MAGGLHRILEGKATLFAVLTTVVISIGGLAEIAPMFTVSAGPASLEGVTPYTALEVAGRDIYIREGCYVCHSQMIRPMRAETLRYGEWTRAGEYAYEHPFLLGSRRIGPDLQRVGGKWPDAWHFDHMKDPRSMSPGSIMPPYPWLLNSKVEPSDIAASLTALRATGVPYTDAEIANVEADMKAQGELIAGRIQANSKEVEAARVAWDDEIVALTAYLQRLGTDGKRALAAKEAR